MEEFCSKCGTKFEGKFCPTCGTPSKNNIIENARRPGLTDRSWFVILMLFIIFPVGLVLMWRKEKFSKAGRIILTIIGTCWLLFIVICGSAYYYYENSGDIYIDTVKESSPDISEYSGITFGEALDDYFLYPKWRYFESSYGTNIVEFTGYGSYDDLSGTILIQFEVTGSKSKVIYMEFNYDDIDESEIFDGDEIDDILSTIFDEVLYGGF